LGADDDREYLASRMRAAWPTVRIVVRGEAGFGKPVMFDVCERLGVEYTFGLSAHAVLQRQSADLLAEAVRGWEETQTPQRLCVPQPALHELLAAREPTQLGQPMDRLFNRPNCPDKMRRVAPGFEQIVAA
jgi:hypothetical protein